MPRAILVDSPGDESRLSWQEVARPAPGPGEVLLRQTSIGVNFIDIYHRTGVYPLPHYPHGIGMEAAGVVEEVGPGINLLKKGDRVAYVHAGIGAYAEYRCVAAEKLARLPEYVDNETAAAGMLKGLTAWYLLTRTFPVSKGDTVLIHAAAGGVGLIACQWAKLLGAKVIGTVGSDAKAQLARENGCDFPIVYTQENVPARVREITAWKGVDVVYDSVGQATFMQSLDCLKPRGMMVSFGQSSGSVAPLDIGILNQKGSLYLTRPSLMQYIAKPEDFRAGTAALFDLIGARRLKIRIDRTLPLKDAAEAHRLLAGRKTSGAIVLAG